MYKSYVVAISNDHCLEIWLRDQTLMNRQGQRQHSLAHRCAHLSIYAGAHSYFEFMSLGGTAWNVGKTED